MGKTLTRLIKRLITLILLGVIGFSSYQLYKEFVRNQEEAKALEEVKTIVDVKDNKVTSAITKDKILKLKQVNEDIVAYLQFDSGLVSEPVAQTTDNAYYLDRDVNKDYNAFGTVFMNYKNTLADKNLILYGHAGGSINTQKFSNLNLYPDDDAFYKKNSTFTLYTENDIRKYQISYVLVNKDSSEFDHQIQNFTEEEFNNWIAYAKAHTRVTSLNEIEYKDNFITLQTCLHDTSAGKVILIAKEIGRSAYQED